MESYSKLNKHEHSVLAMMTLVAEVAYPMFKSYKLHNKINRLKERIKSSLGPNADLDANYEQLNNLMMDMGKCLHSHVFELMRTEENSSILSVAQLTMTVGVLRAIAQIVGPLDADPVPEDEKSLAAMQMIARLAFQGFMSETKREDILNWSVGWFKRQIELDYGKEYRRFTGEPEAVGGRGLSYASIRWSILIVRYCGELFRDGHLLDLLTFERITPSTISIGLVFFLFALKEINALHAEHLDGLYDRFITDCDDEAYWRAWWEGVRNMAPSLDNDILRKTILSQIGRTEWHKIYFYNEIPQSICAILSHFTESMRDQTQAIRMPIPGWDSFPLIRTIRHLLREFFAKDVDDTNFRENLVSYLSRVFTFYPPVGEQRRELAREFYQDATTSPMDSRAGDLQLLRSLLVTEAHEMVTDWNKEQCAYEFCQLEPSLQGLVLEELAHWKKRQYIAGLENAEKPTQIHFRITYLLNILLITRAEGGLAFPRDVLEGFWNSPLSSSGNEAAETVFWGGDYITENIRLIFFHGLSTLDFRRYPGLV